MSAPPVPNFPPGYVEQYVGYRTVGVAIAFIVLEISFVALRFGSRHISKVRSGLDDVFIPPALLFCLGVCIIAIVEVKVAGVGRHEDALLAFNPTAVISWAKCGYAIEELYCTAVVFPKLSILGFYLRIFTKKPYRITAYVLGGIIIANGIAGVISSLCTCQPFAARWNLSIPNAHCIDTVQYWRWISLANIITDVVMLVLPLPVVWTLQVSTTQKYGLTFIFLTGSIGLIASLIRFAFFFNVKALSDGTWASANLADWSLIEPGIYLIAACLPSLRPVIRTMYTRVSTSLNNSKRMKKYGFSTGNTSRDIPLESDVSKQPKMGNVGPKGAGFLRLEDVAARNKSGVADLRRYDVRNAEAGEVAGFAHMPRSQDGF